MAPRILERIRNNLPDRKPHAWEHPWLTLQRRALRSIGTQLNSEWPTRRHRTRLAGLDIVMDVSPSLYLEQSIFIFGLHEVETTRFLQTFLTTGMRFVDVGANIGYTALVAARQVGREGSVDAFEPVDNLRARLSDHAALNAMPWIRVYPAAVCDVAGEVTLFESAWDLNHGLGTLVAERSHGVPGRRVPSTTLDALASDGKPIHLIKIDVEGAEESVLRGGQDLLRGDDAPAIIFEADPPDTCLQLLLDAGYAVRRLGYSVRHGITFTTARPGAADRTHTTEAPNFVALKSPRPDAAFDDLSARSRRIRHGLARLMR